MAKAPFLLSHSLASAADAAPDTIAVTGAGAQLSYAELIDRVGRFAAALVSRGVQAGDRIVVHCAKSIDAVVAIHGAQWAGTVSVPVDPAAPTEVVAQMVTDAEAAVLVLDERTAAKLPDLQHPPLCIGAGPPTAVDVISWEEISSLTPVGLSPRCADDPAYIIYTSGSTGTPKGIVHSHRSGLRYAQLAADEYDLQPDDRLANVAPFHFDQSTFELYAAPVARASSVLVPEVLLRFPAEVSKLIAAERCTVLYSVPTILVQLLERGALDHHDISSLRWVLFGGEVFPTESLAALMAHLPGARFSNVYGPAEVNQCTYHHLDQPPSPASSIPIGEAWDDTEVALVDDNGDLVVGPGRGTLEVRSATMMLGYWRRPDLTASSIVERTAGTGLAQRWYRTGDLCERDDQGLLHFLGRTDRQVKLRGNRVELEAVEAALASTDGVSHAAAVIIDHEGEDVLVGVLEGTGVDADAAIATARALLPAYAVPMRIMVVASLPRTGSGKINVRAAARRAEDELIGASP